MTSISPPSGAGGQTVQPTWAQGLAAVFAIDPISGSDAMAGYAVPASSSTADYALACQAAGARAKQTIAGFASVWRHLGAGRKCELVIANGGVNTLATFAEDLGAALAGSTGFASGSPTIRMTGTNPTAGVTKFDGSAADCTYLGRITATGMNAGGYTIIGGPTTTVWQFQQVGGGGAAFGAEPAAPSGYVVRGDVNNTTNANVVRFIPKVAGGDTITFVEAWPSLPVAGEKYYIERPGVTVASFDLGNLDSNGGAIQVAGLNITNDASHRDTRIAFSGCTFDGTYTPVRADLTMQRFYTHPVRGAITAGGSRIAGNLNSSLCGHTLSGLVTVGGQIITLPTSWQAAAGWVSAGAAFLRGARLETNVAAFGSINPVGSLKPRILSGGLVLQGGGAIGFGQIDILGGPIIIGNQAGAPTALGQQLNLAVAGANTSITGSGSPSCGLHVADGVGCRIVLDRNHLPTLTGIGGDVIEAGGTTTTWATAAAGLTDSGGNVYYSAP